MKILLCIAGMPYAEATVRFGGGIAGSTQSSVTLLHVISRRGERVAGRRVLDRAHEMLPDLTVTRRIRQGDPTERILTEIRRGHHNLVVVGASQGSPLTQRLLGSVTLQIIRRAPISVLVVRRAGPHLERVLICTGGLDVAEPVIEAGSRLAEAAHARAALLHVISPVPSMYTGLDEIEETLPELLQTDTPTARHLRSGAEILARHRVSAELKLRYGVAADEILSEAREGDYDLVVIGASGTAGRLRGWLLGDVTRQVVEHAPRSVLVVRPA
ncbi:MAG TPA: universal stress protein [Anaerolineales bacterium]|nr:universal stress protein [Anaerolineae bacterium]HIQ01214.1 universal stress protein [Anaerolineales bacterium]